MDFEYLYQRGLSFEKLRAFLSVVRAGSVIAAAQGDNSRRSLMSRQIGELEKTISLVLFQRKGKSLSLTDSGRELALITTTYFDEIASFVDRRTGGETNLRIGAGASTLEALVFPRILGIRKQFEKFQFEFVTDNTQGLLRSLRQGDLDLAIVRASDHGKDLKSFPCGKLEFAVIGRIDYDTNITEWNLKQVLSRVPLALIRGEGEFITAFNRLSQEIGVDPKIRIRADSFGQVRQLLLAGHPGGILPKQLCKDLASTEFNVITNDKLGCLTRDLIIVVDKRVTKIKDRLTDIAEEFAKITREI